MVVLDNEIFNHKEEIPTARFWLMLKLIDSERWSSRWTRYIDELTSRLREGMKNINFTGPKEKAEMEIRNAIHKTIEKLEKGAWFTMPSEFLKRLGIPRNIRR